MPPRKNNAPALVAAASTAEVPSAVEAQEPEAVVEPHVLTDIDRLMRGGGQDERALPLYLQDWAKTIELLKAPFHPDDVSFLPQTIDYTAKTATAAAYADSRVYTARMNEVIGYGFWQSEVTRVDIAPFTKILKAKLDYKTKEVISPQSEISAHKVGAIVRVGIWMGPLLGWVWQDSSGAKDTADENWITSAEAQAYKRAMSKWGPGIYFYSFGKLSYPYDPKTGQWKQQPQIPEWAYPINYCNDCGEQIVTIQYTDKDNITQSMHAWDIYLRGMAQYGVGVCPKCSKARRNAATSPEAQSRLQEQQAA